MTSPPSSVPTPAQETRATWIIYLGAGRPALLDADRAPIRTHAPARCGHCDDPAGVYRFDDCVSDNFLPTTSKSALLQGSDALCVACAFCVRDLRLRCCAFVARATGVWFVRRRDLLRALLDPPETPFVVGLPLMGAGGGGESAGWRALWSHEPPIPEGLTMPGPDGKAKPVKILARLQAKMTAPYCATAHSRTRFALQVDGDRTLTVDVPLWTATVRALDALRDALLAAGCWFTETQQALLVGTIPTPAKHHDARRLGAVVRRWRDLTAPLRPYYGAAWFKLLVTELYTITPGGPDHDRSDPDAEDAASV